MKQIQQWICSDNLHHLHHLQQPLLGRQKSFVEIWVAKLLISVCWPWCWRRQCEKKMSRASVSEWSVGFCLKKRYDNAYIYMYIYVHIGFQEVKERMILVALHDKLRNMSWKVFSRDESLWHVSRCLEIFRIKRRWRRLKQFIVKRFRPESRARFPFFGWVGLVCLWLLVSSYFMVVYGICFLNIFFNILQKPSATPMEDVPRRLNECQVVTSFNKLSCNK